MQMPVPNRNSNTTLHFQSTLVDRLLLQCLVLLRLQGRLHCGLIANNLIDFPTLHRLAERELYVRESECFSSDDSGCHVGHRSVWMRVQRIARSASGFRTRVENRLGSIYQAGQHFEVFAAGQPLAI
jgi:hypothetical protein